jgi:hypothetical protein
VWEGDCPSRGTSRLLSNLQPPCQAILLVGWVCPVRGEVSQSAIPIAIPASGYIASSGSHVELVCRMDLRASARNTPATPVPPNQVASLPVRTAHHHATPLCPHQRIPTATDGDGRAHPWSMAQSTDRSIWRMLGLASRHDAAPARRLPSGAMGALACGLPYFFSPAQSL